MVSKYRSGCWHRFSRHSSSEIPGVRKLVAVSLTFSVDDALPSGADSDGVILPLSDLRPGVHPTRHSTVCCSGNDVLGKPREWFARNAKRSGRWRPGSKACEITPASTARPAS